MIAIYDEDPEHLLPLDTPIHRVDMIRSRPICWPEDKIEPYAATESIEDVTCTECHTILNRKSVE